MENPATQENPGDQITEEPLPTEKFTMMEVNNKEYEIYK